jgi:GAF domain-containing protein
MDDAVHPFASLGQARGISEVGSTDRYSGKRGRVERQRAAVDHEPQLMRRLPERAGEVRPKVTCRAADQNFHFGGSSPDKILLMFEVEIDASVSRAERYRALETSLELLLEGESDALANLSNAAGLLAQSLDRINWCGFYLLRGEELVLGPFQGKPACVRIPLGKGVCGTAAASRETLVVPDVNRFAGHIACDPASRSEIVVPILENGVLRGVLDVDAPEPARFDEEDRNGLERFVAVLIPRVAWGRL